MSRAIARLRELNEELNQPNSICLSCPARLLWNTLASCVVSDVSGTITNASPQFERLFGYCGQELEDKQLQDLFLELYLPPDYPHGNYWWPNPVDATCREASGDLFQALAYHYLTGDERTIILVHKIE